MAKQKPSQWIGSVESCRGGNIHGWAYDAGTDSIAHVDLLIDGDVVAKNIACDRKRGTLADIAAEGQCAFRIPVPAEYFDDKEHAIDVRITGTDTLLEGSPLTLTLNRVEEPLAWESDLPPVPHSKTAAKGTTHSGALERYDNARIFGWAWNEKQPFAYSNLELIIDGNKAAEGKANIMRRDLHEAGYGDGDHGFAILIPGQYLDGKTHDIDIRFAGTKTSLGNAPQTLKLEPLDTPYEGMLDRIEGAHISGWAWNFLRPQDTVKLEIRVNGEHITTVAANQFRQDLQDAAIGDGNKAFDLTLPMQLDASRDYELSVRVENDAYELRRSPTAITFAGASQDPYRGIRRLQVKKPEPSGAPQPIPASKPTRIATRHTSYLRTAMRETDITIIIPVYNAYDETKRCLESVVRNTTLPCRLLIVNDASTDKAIDKLLGEYASLQQVEILRNRKNLGFTRSVNRALEATTGDVVLLNSDTEVTPRWLEHLLFTAAADTNIATVTAVSDNAGAFSVPHIGTNNFPEWIDRDRMGRIVAAVSRHFTPDAPTGNGFCMFIRRAALDDVGHFDDKRFPRGYGEENDFCMRAWRRGWRHVIDDSTLVFHARAASFGKEKEALIEEASKTLHATYPEYKGEVENFAASAPMIATRRNIKGALNLLEHRHQNSQPLAPDGMPRLLYVIHGAATGGTPQTNLDLMHVMAAEYDIFLLECDTEIILLKRYVNGELQEVECFSLSAPLSPTDTRREDYASIIMGLLSTYAIELVHIRHLYKHTLELPAIAAALNIPVVLSFHDFYFVCPGTNLIDEQGNYCGGTCTKSKPQAGQNCLIPYPTARPMPPLKHAWVHGWQEQVAAMLEHADACVTTSEDTRDIYTRTFPALKRKPFPVIEHGRDFPDIMPLARTPKPGEKLRILVPGQLTPHKGADFIARLVELDKGEHLEFHFLGTLPPAYRHLGTWHGPYERDEFASHVRRLECHVIGIFSIWAETYCHTLSEAWACGMPVVASNLGAMRERIDTHGGGWLIDVTKPLDAYVTLTNIREHPEDYTRKAAKAQASNVRTIGDMADDYQRLYDSIKAARRVFTRKSLLQRKNSA